MKFNILLMVQSFITTTSCATQLKYNMRRDLRETSETEPNITTLAMQGSLPSNLTTESVNVAINSMYVMPVVIARVQLRSVDTHWHWLKPMVSSQPFFSGMYVLRLNLTSPLLQCKAY